MERIKKEIIWKLPARARKLMGCAFDYLKNEQWEISLILVTTVLEEVENAFGFDSLHVGCILFHVGCNNAKVDKYDEAESVLKRAISIVERYDKELLLAAKIYNNLGSLYVIMERYEEAEIYRRKTLEIYEKLNNIDALELAWQKVLIGDICLRLKKPDEAKQLLRVALPVYARKFGIGSVEVKDICELLCKVYFPWSDIRECFESLKNSNEIADVIPLCLLGMHSTSRNLPDGAFLNYVLAFKIYENSGFLDELQMDKIYFTLGECYLKISIYHRRRCFYSNESGTFYQKPSIDSELMMVDITIHRALLILCKKSRAKDNEKSGEARLPILKAKCNAIVSTMKNLCANVRRRW